MDTTMHPAPENYHRAATPQPLVLDLVEVLAYCLGVYVTQVSVVVQTLATSLLPDGSPLHEKQPFCPRLSDWSLITVVNRLRGYWVDLSPRLNKGWHTKEASRLFNLIQAKNDALWKHAYGEDDFRAMAASVEHLVNTLREQFAIALKVPPRNGLKLTAWYEIGVLAAAATSDGGRTGFHVVHNVTDGYPGPGKEVGKTYLQWEEHPRYWSIMQNQPHHGIGLDLGHVGPDQLGALLREVGATLEQLFVPPTKHLLEGLPYRDTFRQIDCCFPAWYYLEVGISILLASCRKQESPGPQADGGMTSLSVLEGTVERAPGSANANTEQKENLRRPRKAKPGPTTAKKTIQRNKVILDYSRETKNQCKSARQIAEELNERKSFASKYGEISKNIVDNVRKPSRRRGGRS